MASSQMQPLSLNLDALTYVSSLVEAFRAFDSDNNGMINTAELQGLLSSLGHETNEQQAKDIIITHANSNQINEINIEDFMDTMNAGELGLDGLGDLFQAAIPALGLAGGFIDGEELAKVMSLVGTMSVEDCMDIISCLDCDDDGAISIEEVKLWRVYFNLT